MSDFSFEATSKTFTAEHGSIHYHEAGSGPDLLLIHGSGPGVTGWANFEGNLPIFAENEVYLPVYNSPFRNISRSCVKGFFQSPLGRVDLEHVDVSGC